ncbi:hypothetical protein ABTX24_17805 [Nocardioides sp. NPDC127514]|uniref:hypothetical protein n=1 Tax=unclassified Nocardioides TaxID=2615069 RepID=UPI0033320CE2
MPRLADPRQAVHDVFDHHRSDLDAHVAIALEVGARRVIDLCRGTDSLAVVARDA